MGYCPMLVYIHEVGSQLTRKTGSHVLTAKLFDGTGRLEHTLWREGGFLGIWAWPGIYMCKRCLENVCGSSSSEK